MTSSPSRVEAFIRLQEAILANDRPKLNELKDIFGGEPPLALSISEAVSQSYESKTEGYAELSEILETTARQCGAECVATSYGKTGPRFADIIDKLDPGSAAPQQSDRIIYFSAEPFQHQSYTIKFDQPLKDGAAVHFVGYVHSKSSDHFLVRLNNEDGSSEAVRIGTRGITLERSMDFRDFPGSAPRMLSVVVQDDHVYVFVNGLPFWRQRRAQRAIVTSVSFDLQPHAAHGADAVMLGFEVWKLQRGTAGAIFENGEFTAIDVLKWHLERDNAKDAYQLIRSFPDIDAAPIEDVALDAMARLASSQRGYPEWAIRSIEQTLSGSGRERWAAIKTRLVAAPAIDVRNLTVSLYKDFAHARHFKTMLFGASEKFNAVDDVTFSAYPGDVIGIIGHNGAGKSTLLRTIAGLIPIATGSVRVKQNFMLLRGGIGIQPHLTGRQNVVSAGIYLGLTPAQAKALVPDILEFSELGESFDRPTKYYSDGMLSRLVFAVATSISPEILLLDELLGAGDISFQEKAKRRLDAFLSAARVVVVVTHSIDFVRNNCNKALVMAHGKQLYFGEPSTAVSVYLSHLHLSLGTQQSATRF